MLSLTHRQSFVLNRVVAEASHCPVSSTTVRYEMGGLEETGYLAQAHLFSGRVPTDRGYQHYLDRKANFFDAKAGFLDGLTNRFLERFKSTEDFQTFAEEVALVLSELCMNLVFCLCLTRDQARLTLTEFKF